jgi:hypothetical protein
MKVSRCLDEACGRPFQINEFTGIFSIPGERGKVMCPHCGHEYFDNPDTLYMTHPLSAQEEAEFSPRLRTSSWT